MAALNGVSAEVLARLQELFPPHDQAPNHETRKAMVQQALAMFEDGFTSVLRKLGVPDAHLSKFSAALGQLVPHLANAVVAIGTNS